MTQNLSEVQHPKVTLIFDQFQFSTFHYSITLKSSSQDKAVHVHKTIGIHRLFNMKPILREFKNIPAEIAPCKAIGRKATTLWTLSEWTTATQSPVQSTVFFWGGSPLKRSPSLLRVRWSGWKYVWLTEGWLRQIVEIVCCFFSIYISI